MPDCWVTEVKGLRKLGILTITALLLLQAPIAHAQESFVLEDIEMTGLLRISEGTVLNYLPLREGETIDNEDIQLSIRALFRAGFFEDIEVRRDGSTLIYVFEERPSIASFEVIGKHRNSDADADSAFRRAR